MTISNAQIKSLIEIYTMIQDAQVDFIPIKDISNKAKIKRFETVLNDLLSEKISENDRCNDLYIKTRKEIFYHEK